MPTSGPAPFALGVALLSSYTEHNFLYEILDDAGVVYAPASSDDPGSISGCRAWLVVCHQRDGVGQAWADAVRGHVSKGGALVFVGNPAGLEDVLGAQTAQAANRMNTGWLGAVSSIGEGFAELGPELSRVTGYDRPLHFFGGSSATVTTSTSLGKALGAHCEGRGLDWGCAASDRVTGIFVDVVWTVRRITHGIPVTSDAVPAPDGSAPLDDNILKAEDGLVLDWTCDRSSPDGSQFPFFADPLADCWCEILLHEVFSTAKAAGCPLKMVWRYPRNLSAIGHISFDTDANDPELAHKLLDVINETHLSTTWYVIAPGYPRESGVIERAKQLGVEIGLHFDAGTTPLSKVDEWSYDNFRRQFEEVAAACDVSGFTSNKDHYTRWQNQTDLPEWCAKVGIGVDETRLPSKPGTLGFFSGTSHPWFPHDQSGQPIDCLLIAGLSQDPIVTVPVTALLTLLERAAAHRGIASFTFHPAHIAKPGVADALRQVIRAGSEIGLEWWNAKQIGDWVRLRRSVTVSGDGGLVASEDQDISGFRLLELTDDGELEYLGFRFA